MLKAKHCIFKCASDNCIAQDTAILDQIIIGTKDNDTRQEALKTSCDLETLGRECMKMESATRGGAEINGEDIYKMGTYSFISLKKKESKEKIIRKIRAIIKHQQHVTMVVIKQTSQ